MADISIQPYLFFGGRCDEALKFYGDVLGAQVEFLMRFNESPDPPPPGTVPPGFEDKVMHAAVRIGSTFLFVSDGCDPDLKFQGFSLSIAMTSEEEAHKTFTALSEGGQVQMPLTKTFWSPCFGMLIDRFGINWMINVSEPCPE